MILEKFFKSNVYDHEGTDMESHFKNIVGAHA